MSDLILILGVAGAGKDFKADKFIEDSKAFGKTMVKINFADELREMMWDLIAWKPAHDLEYEWFKQGRFSLTVEDGSNKSEVQRGSNRILLQRMGTEVIRKRFPDMWAQLWAEKAKRAIEENKKVVCSDLRFLNELEYAMRLCTGKDYKPCTKTFIFSNYISDRYNATMDHPSEKLAQRIRRDGHQDGEELSFDYLSKLIQDEELRKEQGL